MRRRYLLATGVAAVAAAAGIGVALWRDERDDAPFIDPWALRFPRPEGGEIVMAALRGRPLLLNFWATWCAPCVTEMPLLARFYRQHRSSGWQVVGLAVDQPEPVRRFIAETGIDFPVGIADASGLDLARSLGNGPGGLPFSVVFGRGGQARRRKLGALDEATLQDWAAAV